MEVNAYLKPDGFIITNGIGFDGKDMIMVFQNPFFTAWRKTLKTSFLTDSLTLVMSPFASQKTETLASLIAGNHKGTVTRILLNDVATNTHLSDNVVVLSNLDENLFFDVNEAGAISFEAVQKLLTSANKNIIWLLRGASMESSIITAPVRSADAITTIILTTDLDKAMSTSHDASPNIYR